MSLILMSSDTVLCFKFSAIGFYPNATAGMPRLLVVPIIPVLTTWIGVRSEESEGGAFVFRVLPHHPFLQEVN